MGRIMPAPKGNRYALGNRGGRPTKYDPSFCERVVELGKRGFSLCEIASDLMIVTATLSDWARKNKEFSAAMDLARQLSQAWWEEKGRAYLVEGEIEGKGKINASLYSRSMAARFPDDWRENNKTIIVGDKNQDPVRIDHNHDVTARLLKLVSTDDLEKIAKSENNA